MAGPCCAVAGADNELIPTIDMMIDRTMILRILKPTVVRASPGEKRNTMALDLRNAADPLG